MKKILISDIAKMQTKQKDELLLNAFNSNVELNDQLKILTKQLSIAMKEISLLKQDRINNQKIIRTIKAKLHTNEIDVQQIKSQINQLKH